MANSAKITIVVNGSEVKVNGKSVSYEAAHKVITEARTLARTQKKAATESKRQISRAARAERLNERKAKLEIALAKLTADSAPATA